ncbi:MAG: hypothetical protein PHQ05_07500 [Sterolibacterium sp.]|nr:hypothetical protein [Sterolibacterium sp.]
MRWRAFLLAACGLCFPAALAAAEARGSRSCHKWAEERNLAEGFKEMNKVPVLISKSWFLGYLAGRQAKARQDFLGATDNESIYLWLDKYCREHPQENLASAGEALEHELIPGKGSAH